MPRGVALTLLWISLASCVSGAAEAGVNLFKLLAEAGVPSMEVEAPGSTLGSGRPGLMKMLHAAGVSDRWNDEAASSSMGPPDADPRLSRLLVRVAGQPNVRFENGETALIRAVRQDLEEGVELLLDMGADVELKDSHGRTAYWHAERLGNPEILKLLASAGAGLR